MTLKVTYYGKKEHRDNSKLREKMQEYGVKTMGDVHHFVKLLTTETIQAALEVELESKLGYSKYDYRNKETDNSRNGYTRKMVQGSLGEMEINVPCDHQMNLSRARNLSVQRTHRLLVFLLR